MANYLTVNKALCYSQPLSMLVPPFSHFLALLLGYRAFQLVSLPGTQAMINLLLHLSLGGVSSLTSKNLPY